MTAALLTQTHKYSNPTATVARRSAEIRPMALSQCVFQEHRKCQCRRDDEGDKSVTAILLDRPDRRWLGGYLLVDDDAIAVTTRAATRSIRWSDIDAVELHPMDTSLAQALRIPAIPRPSIVGTGSVRRHRFPYRRLLDHIPFDGHTERVALDVRAFVYVDGYSEFSRLCWRHRPDVASALGFSPLDAPTELTTTPDLQSHSLPHEYRSSTTTGKTGHELVLRLPELGVFTVNVAGDTVTARHPRGDIVVVRALGGRRNSWLAPIGTRDRTRLSLTVNGVELTLFTQTHPYSRGPHQYAVTDNAGSLLSLRADYSLSGSRMDVREGVLGRATAVTLRRLRDGNVEVRLDQPAAEEMIGELTLSLALATALGTRSAQLRDLTRLAVWALSNSNSGFT